MLLFILGYIACFALSVGPVTWVILSEIFPTRIRGRAMAIATVCLWIANYIVSQTFPMMDANPWLVATFHRGFPFWLYGAFCVVLLVFVWAFVPETKGKTLEEIERHWTGAVSDSGFCAWLSRRFETTRPAKCAPSSIRHRMAAAPVSGYERINPQDTRISGDRASALHRATDNKRSPCAAEGEEKRDNTQGLEGYNLHYHLLYLCPDVPRKANFRSISANNLRT